MVVVDAEGKELGRTGYIPDALPSSTLNFTKVRA